MKISHFTRMLVVQQIENIGQKFHGGVLTIGNFDGLHLGHQALLAQLQKGPAPRVVMTFDPHPVQVLQPDRQLRLLFPREDLIERLPAYGVDLLLILPFDREFAALSARAFFDRYIQAVFHPRRLVVGYDFAFGSGREGSNESLKAWGQESGVQVDVVEPLKQTMHQASGLGAVGVISSRRLRELIEAGEVDVASQLLSRPFYLRGQVVRGAGRGRAIGVPTLNQQVVNETFPKTGVYISQVRWKGHIWDSVTNVGVNPTFAEATSTAQGLAIKVETHILDGEHPLLGEVVDVDLLRYVRDERKFPEVESLVRQIGEDIAQAKVFFKSRGPRS